jgi:hypothetical protein
MGNPKEMTIVLASGKTHEITVRDTAVEGLVAHRRYVHKPSTDTVVPEQGWQISHVGTGYGLLQGSQCPKTLREARLIAKALSDHDWTRERPVDDTNLDQLKDEIRDALLAINNEVKEDSKEVVERKYIVRRRDDGPGYEIVDASRNTVVDTRIHRGLAWQRATELNEES